MLAPVPAQPSPLQRPVPARIEPDQVIGPSAKQLFCKSVVGEAAAEPRLTNAEVRELSRLGEVLKKADAEESAL